MVSIKYFGIIKHKWLRVPYQLNIRNKKIRSSNYPTFVFIHGLGATAAIWDELLALLPAESNYITLDMLGFGDSPNPEWENYDVSLQAKMLNYAYKNLKTRGPLVIVGHSLGSLVAIEYANKYPKNISRIILCSPPIYKNDKSSSKLEYEKLLIKIYTELAEDKEKLLKLYILGKKTKIDTTVSVDESNILAISESLNSSIIKQNSFNDIKKISVPIDIIYGIVDPVVISANINQLANEMQNITVTKVAASHTINKAYKNKLLDILNDK